MRPPFSVQTWAFWIPDCLKNIKDARANQKRLQTDLKRHMEYLASDKRMSDEKKKELKSKNKNRNDLQAELVGGLLTPYCLWVIYVYLVKHTRTHIYIEVSV